MTLADVDVSIDGGTTWETVLHQTTDVAGPREDVLPLPMAAGEPDVQVRFHYYDATYDWWWQVDDVFVGNRTCDPRRGGLVVGNVRGATGRRHQRRDRDQPGQAGGQGRPRPHPGRPGARRRLLPDVLVADRRHPFEAKANQYGSQRKRSTWPRDWVTTRTSASAAGHLTVTPTSLQTTSTLGGIGQVQDVRGHQ